MRAKVNTVISIVVGVLTALAISGGGVRLLLNWLHQKHASASVVESIQKKVILVEVNLEHMKNENRYFTLLKRMSLIEADYGVDCERCPQSKLIEYNEIKAKIENHIKRYFLCAFCVLTGIFGLLCFWANNCIC